MYFSGLRGLHVNNYLNDLFVDDCKPRRLFDSFREEEKHSPKFDKRIDDWRHNTSAYITEDGESVIYGGVSGCICLPYDPTHDYFIGIAEGIKQEQQRAIEGKEKQYFYDVQLLDRNVGYKIDADKCETFVDNDKLDMNVFSKDGEEVAMLRFNGPCIIYRKEKINV
jgi:hypothetical protein